MATVADVVARAVALGVTGVGNVVGVIVGVTRGGAMIDAVAVTRAGVAGAGVGLGAAVGNAVAVDATVGAGAEDAVGCATDAHIWSNDKVGGVAPPLFALPTPYTQPLTEPSVTLCAVAPSTAYFHAPFT